MIKSKKHIFVSALLFVTALLPAQEALKSIEEEYYDFLSLTGVVERPTLGYRTLSDSIWNFKDIETFEENEDGTFTKVRVPGAESTAHIWKNNNLGTTYTLWQPSNPSENWFTRGLTQGIKLRLYGPEWYNSYNTATPYGQNDGALWQGRGYNSSLTAGLRLEGYGFEVTFKPQMSFMQNKEFQFLPGNSISPYNYFTNGIDLVQRYGSSSFWNYNWGDSEVRWSWHSFTMGFGTQNPWLGPAWLNPMLGSNNAAGFPKFDIGLRKTQIIIPGLNWNLGDFEGRVWVGKLTPSDFSKYTKDTMVSGISLSYAPSFIPGLSLGVNRVFMTNWKIENLKYIGRLFTLSNDNDVNGEGEDQKVAIFLDYIFPRVGFEVYFEIGLDDFSIRPAQNPFHTAIYTAGLKQKIPYKNLKLNSELFFEFNFFEMSQDFQMQWQYGGYYVHHQMAAGYTYDGQVLGAGSGQFGNSQYLGYKLYYPKGSTMLYAHRYSPNNNYIFNKAVNVDASKPSDTWRDYWGVSETYLCIGLSSDYFVTDNLNAKIDFTYIHIFDYMYIRDNSLNSFRLSFNLKYFI